MRGALDDARDQGDVGAEIGDREHRPDHAFADARPAWTLAPLRRVGIDTIRRGGGSPDRRGTADLLDLER